MNALLGTYLKRRYANQLHSIWYCPSPKSAQNNYIHAKNETICLAIKAVEYVKSPRHSEALQRRVFTGTVYKSHGELTKVHGHAQIRKIF